MRSKETAAVEAHFEVQRMTLESAKSMYAEWVRCVVERDREGLAHVLSDDYVFTTPDGQRIRKDRTIDIEMAAPPPQAVGGFSLQSVSEKVVIVRGHDIVKGDFPSEAASPALSAQLSDGVKISFTSVWHYTRGRWRVVSNDAHVTASPILAGS